MFTLIRILLTNHFRMVNVRGTEVSIQSFVLYCTNEYSVQYSYKFMYYFSQLYKLTNLLK